MLRREAGGTIVSRGRRRRGAVGKARGEEREGRVTRRGRGGRATGRDGTRSVASRRGGRGRGQGGGRGTGGSRDRSAQEPAVKGIATSKVGSGLPTGCGMVRPPDKVARTTTEGTLSKNVVHPVLRGTARGEGPVIKGRICGDVGGAPASAEAEAHREPEADVDALGAGGGKRTAIG